MKRFIVKRRLVGVVADSRVVAKSLGCGTNDVVLTTNDVGAKLQLRWRYEAVKRAWIRAIELLGKECLGGICGASQKNNILKRKLHNRLSIWCW